MKKTVPLSLTLVALMGLTGCSQNETATGAEASNEEVTTLRLSHL